VHEGQHQTIALIEQLTTEQNSIVRLCELFKVARSSYYYHLKNRGRVNPERESLRERLCDFIKIAEALRVQEPSLANLIKREKILVAIKLRASWLKQVLSVSSRKT
jgi:hypothetical protein